MSIPKEIREIERPTNTIVFETKTGKYCVRERLSVKYVKGKNAQPVNGKVVGYIIDGKYIPKVEKISNEPQILSYGSSALIYSISKDIYEDLLKIFPPNNSLQIMVIAALKIIKPESPINRFSSYYQRTYLSNYFPDCHLSKNTVSGLYNSIGKDGNKREKFYQLRLNRIPANHKIAIDGTLKQDTSVSNSLSNFSYKSRVKGCKEVSVIYAYDLDNMEPICSTVFPGNFIDASSYREFISSNNINKGIIVSDKGFPITQIEDILQNNKDLHFITPLRRNDLRIKNNNLNSFKKVLTGIEKNILTKKVKLSDNRYLYAFKDISMANKEHLDFINKSKKKDEFDPDEYNKKNLLFGTITLESDLDLPEEIVYKCYEERWKLELVFRAYKNDECLDRTNVQADYSVYGLEFINFISTLITTRIIKVFEKEELFNNLSYGEIMEDLYSAWKKVDNKNNFLPYKEDENWVHVLPSIMELMIKLGLVKETYSKVKRKRGRPSKNSL